MADVTDELMLLCADEALKQAKGFMLFACDESGDLWLVANTTHLNQAEVVGLDVYRKRDYGEFGEETEY